MLGTVPALCPVPTMFTETSFQKKREKQVFPSNQQYFSNKVIRKRGYLFPALVLYVEEVIWLSICIGSVMS